MLGPWQTVFAKALLSFVSKTPAENQKEHHPNGWCSFLVREMGLEPTRRNHTHLKRACLPFQHSRERPLHYNLHTSICQ